VNAPALRNDEPSVASTFAPWRFRLYTAGQSPRSLTAVANLHALCHAYLQPGYQIEVIDLLDEPQRAAVDQVLAIPTLVRLAPTPRRQVVGDLSDVERVVAALEMRGT
jgi:circadian clock protein KaiB